MIPRTSDPILPSDRRGNRFYSDIRCPSCTSPMSAVINSGNAYREGGYCRRRVCKTCSNRFTTVETIIDGVAA